MHFYSKKKNKTWHQRHFQEKKNKKKNRRLFRFVFLTSFSCFFRSPSPTSPSSPPFFLSILLTLFLPLIFFFDGSIKEFTRRKKKINHHPSIRFAPFWNSKKVPHENINNNNNDNNTFSPDFFFSLRKTKNSFLTY